MSDDILAGIEDIVDDFCEDQLNKINSNIGDGVSLSSSKTSNSWSSLSSRLERPDFEREYMGAYPRPREYMNDVTIECHCGVKMNLTVLIEQPDYRLRTEELMGRNLRTDDIWCASCGTQWRTVGTVIKLQLDLFEERRRSNDRNERNKRWF